MLKKDIHIYAVYACQMPRHSTITVPTIFAFELLMPGSAAYAAYVYICTRTLSNAPHFFRNYYYFFFFV